MAEIISGANDGKGLLVWVLQTGEPLHIDSDLPRPMRAMNLSDMLVRAGHRVVLWSSVFHHQGKRHRSTPSERIRVSDRLEIRLIPSNGYTRNIGLGRLFDHAQLGLNLKALLRVEEVVPDVAFIGYPPIETAAVLTRWLAARGVPSLLDVKDQWPTIFLTTVPTPLRPAARPAFAPYFHLARRAMRDATGLSAMATPFLQWALALAGRERKESDGVFPLTSPMDEVPDAQMTDARRWWDAQGIPDDGTARVMFVGSYSQGFDFRPVQEAAKRAADEPAPCEFVICGNGDSSTSPHAMLSGLPNVHFPGWIDRPRLVALAERCRAALAPYRNTEDFQMSLPNKVLDALSLGLPVLSPLQGEVASLITTRGVGLRYGSDSGMTLHDCILALTEDRGFQGRLAQNARTTYTERFSFQMVYDGLVTHLEALTDRGVRSRVSGSS